MIKHSLEVIRPCCTYRQRGGEQNAYRLDQYQGLVMDLIDMTRPSVYSPSQSVLLCEVHGLPAVLKLYLAHPYAGNAVGEIYSIPQHSPYSLKRKYTLQVKAVFAK